MKKRTSSRLEQALIKLYSAFHNQTLNPECCTACAVGNILDGKDAWKHMTDAHGSLQLNYVGRINEAFDKRFNGYLPSELLRIEAVFLEACGFELPLSRKAKKPYDPVDPEVLFHGLSAVIAHLCELDNVPNVMAYTEVFEKSLLSRKNRTPSVQKVALSA